ncbi:MAG TPA: hypothetical protein VNL14_10065 [Candidatus Acidoferrales bacterium]|nr:hypothetical protein [Candidatus Acidoferrales bacterium]
MDIFDTEKLLSLGFFNQVIPIWQVFFFIISLLPFLLLNRPKICLLITYMFTYYLGFMVQWGDYIAAAGSMAPFALYALCGMAIAVFFVCTFFGDESKQVHIHFSRYPAERREPRSVN